MCNFQDKEYKLRIFKLRKLCVFLLGMYWIIWPLIYSLRPAGFWLSGYLFDQIPDIRSNVKQVLTGTRLFAVFCHIAVQKCLEETFNCVFVKSFFATEDKKSSNPYPSRPDIHAVF